MNRRPSLIALPVAAVAAFLSLPPVEARAEQAGPSSDAVAKQKVAQQFQSNQTPVARTTLTPDKWPAEVKAIFVGVTGGVGFAKVNHPQLGSAKVLGPMLSFQLGYRVTERWALSLVYTDFQQAASRPSGNEVFAASSSWLHALAECDKCDKKSKPGGGNILDTTMHLASLGPSVDVTPLGKNGPFVGAGGGLTMATVVGTRFGVTGTARAGLRLRPVENLGLGIEGGIQGQTFTGGNAMVGYTSAEVRLSF